MKTTRTWLSFPLLSFLALSAYAAAPGAVDRGPLDAREAATPMSITVALALPKAAEAEALQRAMYTPGDPQFHKFLTSAEFAQRFAPTDADIAKVASALAKYNLKVEKTTATTLKVSGLPADFERTFSVSLHSFAVPAHGKLAGYNYRAPTGHVVIPAEIAQAVSAVVGLDNSPVMQPMYKVRPPTIPTAPASASSVSSGYDPLGEWTVLDFAKYYDVDPLYKKGLTGAGRTIGIMTFAALTPSDAFNYWASIGLTVNPNRISVVNVDGGPGAPSDDSGSVETSIDVEQSGGVAPGANIIIYQGPNFYTTVVDVFARAVEDNKADSLSMSWGAWEWYMSQYDDYTLPDPITGKTVSGIQAVHDVLLRASLQGQSIFASSGDYGAYGPNETFGCLGPYSPSVAGSCSDTLGVLFPAADSYITATGGTTLPGLQQYCENAACTPPYYDVNVPHERVWGWDYLEGFCQSQGYTPITCGIYPVGSGGGVSVFTSVPEYQSFLFGSQVSQPGQAFYLQPEGLIYKLPAFYPGRNLPDVSFNADPQTGYLVYYTSNVSGFSIQTYGGTSVVAPQFNGVMALIEQQQKGRVGFLNPTFYSMFQNGLGYLGSDAPFHPIAYGDNWFYYGSPTYNLGAGIGTLDVANFAQALHGEF